MHKYLVFKKDAEDGPDVKGGQLEALIVHATKVQKISENGKLMSNSHVKYIPLLSTSPQPNFNGVVVTPTVFVHLFFTNVFLYFFLLSILISFLHAITCSLFIHVIENTHTHTQNYLLVWSRMVHNHFSSHTLCFFIHCLDLYFQNCVAYCFFALNFHRIVKLN